MAAAPRLAYNRPFPRAAVHLQEIPVQEKIDKAGVIRTLEQIAVLKELHGMNVFEIRAFANAARVLESDARDLETLVETGELEKLKGIGKGSIARIVRELHETGKCAEEERLKKPFPESLFELFSVPGLGPRKIRGLFEKLHIDSISSLEEACRENRLTTLEGFGEKSQQNILKQIAHLKKTRGYFVLDEAAAESAKLAGYLGKSRAAKKVTVAGSIRRSREIVRDIDILVATDEPAAIHDLFVNYPGAENVTSHGETRSSIVLESGMACDLRTVSKEEYPYALFYFTGCKEHGVALRAAAKKKGIKVNEYGLYKGTKRIPCRDEKDIYRALGLHYIPPEARENIGEIEMAAEREFPRLVEEKDIRGIFHVHSTYSDGKAPLADMVAEAEKIGYEYIGISDHSQSARYAGGLDPEKLRRQFEEIEKLRKKHRIRIFRGIESDILNDGSLDYEEKILKQFDFIIGSVHSGYNMKQKEMTERLSRAMDNKYLTFLGHMTGRLLLGREGYPLDMDYLFDKAAAGGVTIEFNVQPKRLDPDWRLCHSARRKGVRFSIHPDAHSIEGLYNLRSGVGVARKAWLEKKHVMNTLPLAEMEKFLKSRR